MSLKDTMSLSGSIIQAEAYDMDKDGKDDIVTLDDAGQIHVFYGSGTQKNPTFQKKYIGDGYAISLSDEAISHGGAVYFDGLTQIDEERALDILRNSQDYLDAVGEEILSGGPDAGENMPENTTIDESFVERYLYVSLPYLPTNFSQDNIPGESTPAGTQENANAQNILLEDLAANLSTIGGSSEAESLSGVTDELGNFLDQYE